jgi:formate hydrogenlyase subunit 3/multisubunit Na+/H+ antiporter MnhD subunit
MMGLHTTKIGTMEMEQFETPDDDHIGRNVRFICAGVVSHTTRDSQDTCFMGNLSFQIPFTPVCLSISTSALCGVPFLAGF